MEETVRWGQWWQDQLGDTEIVRPSLVASLPLPGACGARVPVNLSSTTSSLPHGVAGQGVERHASASSKMLSTTVLSRATVECGMLGSVVLDGRTERIISRQYVAVLRSRLAWARALFVVREGERPVRVTEDLDARRLARQGAAGRLSLSHLHHLFGDWQLHPMLLAREYLGLRVSLLKLHPVFGTFVLRIDTFVSTRLCCVSTRLCCVLTRLCCVSTRLCRHVCVGQLDSVSTS